MKGDILKICIITGSRAEYGLLYPLLSRIQQDDKLKLQLIVTGMHLSSEFGSTYKFIEEDGFIIDDKIEILLSSDSDVGVLKSIGLGIISISESIRRLTPDWIVILGDRFETLASAICGCVLGIPLAHIHGGELTLGAYDDAFRHSVTKMSFLHFSAAETYRKRIIQLGEDESRVFNVGPLGLDNIKALTLFDPQELAGILGIDVKKETVLVTFHPETLDKGSAANQFLSLLSAIHHFSELQFVFTYPNADSDGRIIIELINKFVLENPSRAFAYKSLGQKKYLSLLKNSALVLGNSSSGIIEAPFFNIPTVNIGDRQKGRIKGPSVIDCLNDTESIINAINQALVMKSNYARRIFSNPKKSQFASDQIIQIIKSFGKLTVIKKGFKDLPQL